MGFYLFILISKSCFHSKIKRKRQDRLTCLPAKMARATDRPREILALSPGEKLYILKLFVICSEGLAMETHLGRERLRNISFIRPNPKWINARPSSSCDFFLSPNFGASLSCEYCFECREFALTINEKNST